MVRGPDTDIWDSTQPMLHPSPPRLVQPGTSGELRWTRLVGRLDPGTWSHYVENAASAQDKACTHAHTLEHSFAHSQ